MSVTAKTTNPLELCDYRPISYLPALSKIYERITFLADDRINREISPFY